jgi:hypothetical protein
MRRAASRDRDRNGDRGPIPSPSLRPSFDLFDLISARTYAVLRLRRSSRSARRSYSSAILSREVRAVGRTVMPSAIARMSRARLRHRSGSWIVLPTAGRPHLQPGGFHQWSRSRPQFSLGVGSGPSPHPHPMPPLSRDDSGEIWDKPLSSSQH